ncbi:MAG: glucose 1-dehydrogenase [Proteobacteria bacterium]|nr:glucose 1-dehydrogenase [Pseudomonadota bacterium]
MEKIPKSKIKGVRSLFDLTDRTAVITGGSRGLGRGMALALAAAGVDVAVVSRTHSDLNVVAEEIRELGRRGIPICADVRDENQVERMVQHALKELKRIDILINSAGTVSIRPTIEFPVDDWQRVIDVNLRGVFLCCKHVGKAMLNQGRGKIINISSVRGLQGRANDPAYPSSKGAVNMLTKSLAIEWAKNNITVNALAPTFISTSINATLLDDKTIKEWILSRIPMGRIGEIWDLFGPVLFLASSASDFITGEVIYVDGGWTSF